MSSPVRKKMSLPSVPRPSISRRRSSLDPPKSTSVKSTSSSNGFKASSATRPTPSSIAKMNNDPTTLDSPIHETGDLKNKKEKKDSKVKAFTPLSSFLSKKRASLIGKSNEGDDKENEASRTTIGRVQAEDAKGLARDDGNPFTAHSDSPTITEEPASLPPTTEPSIRSPTSPFSPASPILATTPITPPSQAQSVHFHEEDTSTSPLSPSYPARPKLRLGMSYTPPPSYTISPRSPFAQSPARAQVLVRSESERQVPGVNTGTDLGVLRDVEENDGLHHQQGRRVSGRMQMQTQSGPAPTNNANGGEHDRRSMSGTAASTPPYTRSGYSTPNTANTPRHPTPITTQQVWLCTPPPPPSTTTPSRPPIHSPAGPLPIAAPLPSSPLMRSNLSLPAITPTPTPRKSAASGGFGSGGKPLVIRAMSTGKTALIYEGGCMSDHCGRVLKGRVSSPAQGKGQGMGVGYNRGDRRHDGEGERAALSRASTGSIEKHEGEGEELGLIPHSKSTSAVPLPLSSPTSCSGSKLMSNSASGPGSKMRDRGGRRGSLEVGSKAQQSGMFGIGIGMGSGIGREREVEKKRPEGGKRRISLDLWL